MTVVFLYFHASCICKWNMQLIFVNRVFLREWYCEIADSCWGVREFLGMLCTCFYENRPLVLLWTQPISHRFLYRRSLFNINCAHLFRYVTQQLMKWHCFQRTVYKKRATVIAFRLKFIRFLHFCELFCHDIVFFQCLPNVLLGL